VSLDTLRADYINSYGYSRYSTTPFLDSFAKQNFIFENSFVVEPFTLTSHMSLMTGLYPQHHGVEDAVKLPKEIPTLAELLRDEGYRTQAFSSGGYLNPRWGFDRGFDDYGVMEAQGFDTILPRARSWLEAQAGHRVFLFLHTYDIHNEGLEPRYESPAPYDGMFAKRIESKFAGAKGNEFIERFRAREGVLSDIDEEYIRASYAEGVRHVDDALGKFFGELRKLGRYEDALIVVWSDHGEGLYDHVDWSHGEVFDHTLRVPLMVKIPGRSGGRRIRSVVSAIDLAPTVLALAAARVPESIDGRSLLPLLDADHADSLAFGRSLKGGKRLFSVRSKSHHYIWDDAAQRSYFYDVVQDPLEQKNLSSSGSDVERELRERLLAWVDEHDRVSGLGVPMRADPPGEALKANLRALGYVE
jgi:arylsulfatase A-like enzyme